MIIDLFPIKDLTKIVITDSARECIAMRVLISWSGLKSQAAAIALRKWIKIVVPSVDPWMSKLDLEMGVKWSLELSRQLEETNFGIICLTQENISSDWLLFEAGALCKTKGANVCPYLLDLEPTDMKGPLAQFQCAKADKEGTNALIHSINSALGADALSEDLLNTYFEAFWPKLEESLETILDEMNSTLLVQATIDDKVNEILSTVRVQSRIISQLSNIVSKILQECDHSEKNAIVNPQLSISAVDKINSLDEDMAKSWCQTGLSKIIAEGDGKSICQKGIEATIGKYWIKHIVYDDIKTGVALLSGGKMPEKGPAIGYFNIDTKIVEYPIKIKRTNMNVGGASNGISFDLIKS